jgi:DNA-directed RNA polymerase sigma subunit (sigma70/sigma32)
MKEWTRHAKALDMHLAGALFTEIGDELGVSRERARQIVFDAKQQRA